MSKLLKICCSEWINESRDKKELSVAREVGFDVVVMAKGKPDDKFKHEKVAGFDVYRFSTRSLGNIKHLEPINRIINLIKWSFFARKFKPDVISGHDLYALLIGYLSTLFIFKNKKPKLVYDSHEFELGRACKRSKLAKIFVYLLENFLIKRCSFSIMPGDAIADKVKEIHKLKEGPVVIRNVPYYWNIDEKECKKKRKELSDLLNVSEDKFMIMTHGGLLRYRGIESFIRAVSKNKDIVGIVLGNGEENYVKELKKLSREEKVVDRILFLKAVDIEELWKYVGAVDVSLCCGVFKNGYSNHRMCLPNKLFESIQALTPLICNETLVECKKVIDKYDIGLTCDIENTDEVNSCINRLIEDKNLYNSFKENLKIAKKDLCFEKEKQALVNAYKSIL